VDVREKNENGVKNGNGVRPDTITLSNIRMNFIREQTTKQECNSVKPDPISF